MGPALGEYIFTRGFDWVISVTFINSGIVFSVMASRIKGYIFDLDHTLLVSDRAQIDAALWVLERHNIKRTEADVLVHFDKATDEMMKLVAGDAYTGDGKDLGKEHTDRILELIPSITLYPNTEDLIQRVNRHGCKIAFASNNYDRVIAAILKHFNWNLISAGYIGIDDVRRRKPDPEMVRKSVESLQLTAQQCVMIGDSVYDIQAGKAAGTFTVAVCTGSFKKADFEPLHPDLIVDSIAALLPSIPLTFE